MIIIILPLILDYLCNPFELLKSGKSINRNSKKYGLSWITKQKFNRTILPFHKWKYVDVETYSNRQIVSDKDLVYFKNIHTLCFVWNCDRITDDGLKNLTNIRLLNLGRNDSITDEGLKYLINIHALGLIY